MEQNQIHLLYTYGAIMGTMLLPIVFGLIAVFAEGARQPEPKQARKSAPADAAEA